MENKATERMQRQQQWLNKGGRFVRLWRRVRDKSLSDYKRTLMRMGKKVSSRFSSRVDGDGSH